MPTLDGWPKLRRLCCNETATLRVGDAPTLRVAAVKDETGNLIVSTVKCVDCPVDKPTVAGWLYEGLPPGWTEGPRCPSCAKLLDGK